MVCYGQCCSSKGRAIAVLAVTMALPTVSIDGRAQPPLPPGDPSASVGSTALPPYRLPALALVQPPAGGSVPQDRPTVVFRFAPGEASDPIDSRTFAVTVGGENRSALFQVAATEAWGPLAPAVAGQSPVIALGAHRVAARICSVRGACAAVTAVVTVVPPIASSEKVATDRKRSLLELLLLAVRKLVAP